MDLMCGRNRFLSFLLGLDGRASEKNGKENKRVSEKYAHVLEMFEGAHSHPVNVPVVVFFPQSYEHAKLFLPVSFFAPPEVGRISNRRWSKRNKN